MKFTRMAAVSAAAMLLFSGGAFAQSLKPCPPGQQAARGNASGAADQAQQAARGNASGAPPESQAAAAAACE